MYFKKLDYTFTVPDFDVGGLAVEYGIDDENGFHGIWYNHIKEQDKSPIKNIIPSDLRDKFVMQLMEVNSYIPPHTDSDTLAVINFYIETADCVTSFYDIKEGAIPFQLPNQTDGHVYLLEDLEQGPSFRAKPGDIYILDVTKVHSVVPLEGGEIKRKALCLASSSLDFGQVKELFNHG